MLRMEFAALPPAMVRRGQSLVRDSARRMVSMSTRCMAPLRSPSWASVASLWMCVMISMRALPIPKIRAIVFKLCCAEAKVAKMGRVPM